MKSIYLAIILTFCMPEAHARCNKTALQKITKLRKQLCREDKDAENCIIADHDVKRYLTSFASGNNEDCDRIHKIYYAPDKAELEYHKLNVKKK